MLATLTKPDAIVPKLLEIPLWRDRAQQRRWVAFDANKAPRRRGGMAKSNDPATWLSLPEAAAVAADEGLKGVGYVLTDLPADDLCAIDLDNVYDEQDHLCAYAASLVAEASRSGAYVERTVSGRGLRILGAARGLEGVHLNTQKEVLPGGLGGFELYAAPNGRYITVTGDLVAPAAPTTGDITTMFRELRELAPVSKGAPERGARRPVIDLAANVDGIRQEAEAIVRMHPPAIEGAGGNNTTYRLAVKLVGIGALGPLLRELLLQHNEICVPPWSPEELEKLAASAERNSRSSPGAESSLHLLAGVADMPALPANDDRRTEPLELFDVADFEGAAVPPRKWLVQGFIPAETVTLLYGDGGTGKSLLSIQLAAAVVTGQQWLGLPLSGASGRALYLSAEDGRDEVHRRIVDVAAGMGCPLERLRGFQVLDLSTSDATLATFDHSDNLHPTSLWRRIEATVSELRPNLLVLDNLADVFGGNEVVRVQARRFVGLLRHLAATYATTVVVLAHPSQSGMSSGSGTSGSTHWSNSVRSRLYFERAKGGLGGAVDPDLRTLSVMKANYDAKGREVQVRWTAGYFAGQGEVTPVQIRQADTEAEEAFLEGLRSLTRSGRTASDKSGKNSAPVLIAGLPGVAGKFGKQVLNGAMQRLFAAGRIRVVEEGPPSKRYSKIVEVDAAVAPDAAPARLFDPIDPARLASQVASLLLDNAVTSDTAHAVARQLCSRHAEHAANGAAETKRLLEMSFSTTGVPSGAQAADGSIWRVRFRRVPKGAGMEDRIELEA